MMAKEFYIEEDPSWSVYYTREDGQHRLCGASLSLSGAKRIKKAIEELGAQGVFIKEDDFMCYSIDIEI